MVTCAVCGRLVTNSGESVGAVYGVLDSWVAVHTNDCYPALCTRVRRVVEEAASEWTMPPPPLEPASSQPQKALPAGYPFR